MDQNNYENNNYENDVVEAPGSAPQPAKGLAIASMAVGIFAVCCCWESYFSITGLICGIVGLILSSKAKKAGNTSGFAKAGFICSLIAVILGGIIFVSCVACLGAIGAAGAAGGLADLFDL